MEEVDLERLVLPALLALLLVGAFVILATSGSAHRLAELNPSIDLDTLRPGQTLKLAR